MTYNELKARNNILKRVLQHCIHICMYMKYYKNESILHTYKNGILTMHIQYTLYVPINQFSCVQLSASICERISHAIIKLLKCTIILDRSCNRGTAVTFYHSIIQVMWAILQDKTVVIIILQHIELPALAMLLQVAFISHKGMVFTDPLRSLMFKLNT